MSTTSPAHTLWQRLGATIEVVDGVARPQRYTDPVAEARAARSSAILADRNDRDRLIVKGRDRVRFLHGQTTNDVKSLAPGDGCHAAYLLPSGKMVGDFDIRAEAECLRLVLVHGLGAPISQRLAKFVIMDDVTIEPDRREVLHFLLAGPSAPPVLARTFVGEAPTKPWSTTRMHLGDVPVGVTADAETGEYGYEIEVPSESVDAMVDRLLGSDVALAGDLALDVLRIEAGVPRFFRDIDSDTLPVEARLDHAVSYQKGCYVGQEVIARIRTYGEPAWRLMGLVHEYTVPPGVPVLDASGADVGRVSSEALSPAVGSHIALAMLRRSAAVAGGELVIRFDGRSVVTRVVALPFVEPRIGRFNP